MKFYSSFFFSLLFLMSCASLSKKQNNEHIYWINSQKKECVAVGPIQCLQVQKSETIDPNKWEFFYSSINGFDYEPGNIYKLLVKEEKLDPQNVPADASSIKYTLVKILEKMPDKKLMLHDIYALETMEGKPLSEYQYNQVPTIEFNLTEMRISGFDGCNNIFGQIEKVTETEVKLGALGATKRACMNTNIQNSYGKNLGMVAQYQRQGLKLILSDENGNEIMQFKKVD